MKTQWGICGGVRMIREIRQDNLECELNNLCVLPEYRHKRLGHKLLENAFDNARKMNCKKMNIRIVTGNPNLSNCNLPQNN